MGASEADGDLPVGWGRRLLPVTGSEMEGPIHGSPIFLRVPERPGVWLALNMVASVDGRAVVDGTASGLGSESDHLLMRRLRADADAVMHGAGTLRADGATPRVPPEMAEARVRVGRSAQPVGVAVTAGAEFDPGLPFFATATEDWPRYVYTTNPDAPERFERPGITVVVLPGEWVDPKLMLRDLAERNIRTVLCEGGPTLNTSLLAAGAVDEMFLTLAPKVAGRDYVLPIVAPTRLQVASQLALESLYARGSELFLRYRVTPAS